LLKLLFRDARRDETIDAIGETIFGSSRRNPETVRAY
jgi:hypothetical protein